MNLRHPQPTLGGILATLAARAEMQPPWIAQPCSTRSPNFFCRSSAAEQTPRRSTAVAAGARGVRGRGSDTFTVRRHGTRCPAQTRFAAHAQSRIIDSTQVHPCRHTPLALFKQWDQPRVHHHHERGSSRVGSLSTSPVTFAVSCSSPAFPARSSLGGLFSN